MFYLIFIFVLLNFAIGGSHGTMTKEELHWISVFPHTPMPKVLQQILPIPGQSISSKRDIIQDSPENKGVNDPEFGAYWYGDNSDKESKTDNSPEKKGVNDPEFGAYWYGDNSDKEHKTRDSDPTNKGANEENFGLYFVGDSSEQDAKKDSDKESKAEDIVPRNKGANEENFGLYFVGDSSEQDAKKDSDKESKGEDVVARNKGANEENFGLYFVGDSSEQDAKKDSDKESKAEDIANDDHFGLYFVGDSSEQDPKRHSDKEHKSEDIDPVKKGVNDDHFGLYFVGDSSEQTTKIHSNEKSTVKGNRKALAGKSSYVNTPIKETIYFFHENLLPGTKVNLPRLIQKSDKATFLPQQIADSMPLSNDNLPQILKNFSLKPETKAANDVKTTVRNCQRSEMKGETKYCATSLESFVDLGVSILGKHIKLLSHELGKDIKDPYFTIGQGVRKMGDTNIVCHKMKYPYAIYLCHSIEKTEVYKVPLVSKDGTNVKAVAACHKDTSNWSPNHIAFKLLKVKPGSVPICHFLGRDTLVWIPY